MTIQRGEMKNLFSELLSEIISQSEISKNEMIRACDIDRSSFFKFLNGSRLPTPEQLNRICSKLQFSPLEEKKLRTEYARVTQGEQKVRVGDRIATLLWKLEEASNAAVTEIREPVPQTGSSKVVVSGSSQVFELLTNTIVQEVMQGQRECEIDMFLPAFTEDFSKWIINFLGSSLCKNVRIRHLIELPSRSIDSEQLIMDRMRLALLCTAANPDCYSGYYYYSNASMETCVGAFCPYSLVTDHKVIMLNERMNEAIVVEDDLCSEEFKNHFMEALNSSHQLVKIVAAKDVARELINPIKFRYGKFAEKPFKDGTVIYISPASLRNLADKDGDPDFSTEGLIKILNEVKRRMGTQIYLIDDKNIPPAKTWYMALSGREKMIFHKKGGKYYFIITEAGIVDAFYNFMEDLPNSGNLIKEDLAIEFIEGLLSRVRYGKQAE